MSLADSAKSLLESCMGVRPNEQVLVVTDNNRIKIGQALYDAAEALGANPLLLCMPSAGVSGQEPPPAVAAAMRESDVVLCPTTHSLTHTKARIDAAANGARIATMPGITESMFLQGAITADYREVELLTLSLVQRLTDASTAVIKKDGHSLTLSLAGRNGVASTGVYTQPGQGGNLPSGEAYIAPLENASHGSMVIDGSMVGVGKLSAPLTVWVENGCLTHIEGESADKLNVLLENPKNGVLCELGIGTNHKAILCGIILEDEKIYGTVHIAFGTNISFGGTNHAGCHMDGVILRPTLLLDGKIVLQDGVFV